VLAIHPFIENNWLILTSALSTKTSVKASPNAERSPTDSFLLLVKHRCASFFFFFVCLSFFIKKTPSFFREKKRRKRKNKKNKSHSFGRLLSPGHCRRKNALPVSYYALFQGIAASKRTSWLFQHSHILFHLAAI